MTRGPVKVFPEPCKRTSPAERDVLVLPMVNVPEPVSVPEIVKIFSEAAARFPPEDNTVIEFVLGRAKLLLANRVPPSSFHVLLLKLVPVVFVRVKTVPSILMILLPELEFCKATLFRVSNPVG
jgi:hypothetical protein